MDGEYTQESYVLPFLSPIIGHIINLIAKISSQHSVNS